MISRRRAILLGLAAVAAAGGGAGYLSFRGDMRRAGTAIAPELSRIVDTRHGPLEYAEAGSGPPVMMFHGTGGGFDQGLLFSRPLIAAGYRVIAPSRFGYLRTPMPEAAGEVAEAEAVADLMDHLGVARAAVAGGSAGAIPAIAFAIRFPERCAALVPIVPALWIPGRPPVEPWGPWKTRAVFAMLNSDALFWAMVRLAPDALIGSVLATDPALVAAAPAEEQARVREILYGLMPMSARSAGLFYDNTQTNRPLELDLAAIRSPTLTLSCEDDRFQTAENARYLATQVPGAQAVVYPDGGHVWVGRDAEMFGEIDGFLRAHPVA